MMRAALGLVVLLSVAWAISENRRRIQWRTVIAGVALQLAFAAVLIGIPQANGALFIVNDAANALHKATEIGTAFVFGYLAGLSLPFAETHPGASFILAFQALPLTISALSRAHATRRIIRADDLRHGGSSRHGHGHLRRLSVRDRAECARKYRDRFGHQHPGWARGRRPDGAVRPAGRSGRKIGNPRRAGHLAKAVRLAVPPGDVADRGSMGGHRSRIVIDGDKDRAE